MVEAVCAAVFGVLVAFLLMFPLDRVWDTPALAPRWRSSSRRCVGLRMRPAGAPPLGLAESPPGATGAAAGPRRTRRSATSCWAIIELVRNDFEQARSRALCEAAIAQVAEDAAAARLPRRRAEPAASALGLAGGRPGWRVALAPARALSRPRPRTPGRGCSPPGATRPATPSPPSSRCPAPLVVAHGEPFAVAGQARARAPSGGPSEGEAQLGDQHPVAAAARRTAATSSSCRRRSTPAGSTSASATAAQRVQVEPTLRPELTSVVADVTLPDYLGRPAAQQKDVRGGAISLVKGSQATLHRHRQPRPGRRPGRRPAGAARRGRASPARRPRSTASRTMEFRWQDAFGLAGKEPFILSINGRDDEAPSLACEDLPRQKVVLDSETLTFKVQAQDDFGVKRVGMEWQGVDESGRQDAGQGRADPGRRRPRQGSRSSWPARSRPSRWASSRSRSACGCSSRITCRAAPRVYSPPYTLYVLNAEQHAIWLTEQLSKWHRQSLEVRDREMQLLRDQQAAAGAVGRGARPARDAPADREPGRRPSGPTAGGSRAWSTTGEDLVQQAMRNPEFGVGHLEKWAEMLQILKDISGNRMPSVADLLKQAAQAPSAGRERAAAEQRRRWPARSAATQAGQAAEREPEERARSRQPVVPQVVDIESSQQLAARRRSRQRARRKQDAETPRLTLPVTTCWPGKAAQAATPEPRRARRSTRPSPSSRTCWPSSRRSPTSSTACSPTSKGARWSSGSRPPRGCSTRSPAGSATRSATPSASRAPGRQRGPRKVLDELAEQEAKGSHDVSLIMDDMQSYFERRRFMQFKTVLDEMRKQDVIGGLRQLGDDLKKENGLSIAQCEFWSDTLDRWAEDLVDPACGRHLPGLQVEAAACRRRSCWKCCRSSKAKSTSARRRAWPSRPRPAIEGRRARASRPASSRETQDGLRDRVDKVIDADPRAARRRDRVRLRDRPARRGRRRDGRGDRILAEPETGSPGDRRRDRGHRAAAAVEADQSQGRRRRRCRARAAAAAARPTTRPWRSLGGGVNEKEVREDRGVSQATGDSGPSLPEEFRAGLDEYFNRLERGPARR